MAGKLFDHDRQVTVRNRERLQSNKNLLYWYNKLYGLMFRDIPEVHNKVILEVGSGTSPLKSFYPNVLTSDILELDYLDFKFDCMKIDEFQAIKDESLDIITMTNVLHHLKEPVEFLEKASMKLKPGGMVIFAEPYFSMLSSFIYKYVHHEPVELNINSPELSNIEGPLSSANIALPFLIFFSDRKWDYPLHGIYEYDVKKCRYFSPLSYLLAGGISHVIPFPQILYRALFWLDTTIQQLCPRIFSMIYVVKMTKKEKNSAKLR